MSKIKRFFSADKNAVPPYPPGLAHRPSVAYQNATPSRSSTPPPPPIYAGYMGGSDGPAYGGLPPGSASAGWGFASAAPPPSFPDNHNYPSEMSFLNAPPPPPPPPSVPSSAPSRAPSVLRMPVPTPLSGVPVATRSLASSADPTPPPQYVPPPPPPPQTPQTPLSPQPAFYPSPVTTRPPVLQKSTSRGARLIGRQKTDPHPHTHSLRPPPPSSSSSSSLSSSGLPPGVPAPSVDVTAADVRETTQMLRQLYKMELFIHGERYALHADDQAQRAAARAKADVLRREIEDNVRTWQLTTGAAWTTEEQQHVTYSMQQIGALRTLGSS